MHAGLDQTLSFVQVLEFYGLEKQNKWAQLGYESLFFAGFTFLAWAVGVLPYAFSQASSPSSGTEAAACLVDELSLSSR